MTSSELLSNHSGLKFVKTGEKIYSLVSGLVNNSQLSRQQINLKESDTGGKKSSSVVFKMCETNI